MPTIHRTATRFVVTTAAAAAAPIVTGLAGAAVLLAAPSAACAAPVVYDERAGGDIKPSHAPFVLDAGRNTITGTVSYDPLNNVVDADSFRFTVPVGLHVAAVEVSLADVAGDITTVVWGLNTGDKLGWGTEVGRLSAASPGADALELAAAPLPAGPYNLWQWATGNSSPTVTGVAGYMFVFDVAAPALPEPGIGLIALAAAPALLRRRRRRRMV